MRPRAYQTLSTSASAPRYAKYNPRIPRNGSYKVHEAYHFIFDDRYFCGNWKFRSAGSPWCRSLARLNRMDFDLCWACCIWHSTYCKQLCRFLRICHFHGKIAGSWLAIYAGARYCSYLPCDHGRRDIDHIALLDSKRASGSWPRARATAGLTPSPDFGSLGWQARMPQCERSVRLVSPFWVNRVTLTARCALPVSSD
jgi:hypothetical protein